MSEENVSRPLLAQVWNRADEDWYVEPFWVSERLFAEELFDGAIYDPCCGTGRIVISAMQAGHRAYGSDMIDRGWDSTPQNFLLHGDKHDNIVTNPPFDIFKLIALHALRLTRKKVAMILPVARLNAATWLEYTPLKTVYLITPRPSMPPGRVVMAGQKPGGGKADFCWLIWSYGHVGDPAVRWLDRDGPNNEDTLF